MNAFDRLVQGIDGMTLTDVQLERAALRIAMLLEFQAKQNIRDNTLVDEGALLNSIKGSVEKENGSYNVVLGSYGTSYAAIHEFGGTIKAGAYTGKSNKKWLTIPKPAYKGRSARNFNLAFIYIHPKLALLVNKAKLGRSNGRIPEDAIAYILIVTGKQIGRASC